jgi:hypothetical protein
MPEILATQEAEIRRIQIWDQSRQKVRPYLKNVVDWKAQVVEPLPSKCEALTSNSSTKKKKKIPMLGLTPEDPDIIGLGVVSFKSSPETVMCTPIVHHPRPFCAVFMQ